MPHFWRFGPPTPQRLTFDGKSLSFKESFAALRYLPKFVAWVWQVDARMVIAECLYQSLSGDHATGNAVCSEVADR